MDDSRIETMKQFVRHNYGYELTSKAATHVAALADTVAAGSRGWSSLDLATVEAPFGFTTLMEEAARLSTRR